MWSSHPPATDDEIRQLGFEPTRRGWLPLSDEMHERLRAADERRHYHGPVSFRIPGIADCAVCGETTEASTCGTPTCSWVCSAVLMEQLLPEMAESLYTRGDGRGGTPAIRPPKPTPKLRPIAPDRPTIERALECLGDCRTVLERHGIDVRLGRVARCPFHDDEHPSMSLYERGGRSRAHCFPCDWDGDALDLEAALADENLKTTIRRWS